MTNHITESACSEDLTQKQYLGLFDCRRGRERFSIFRNMASVQMFRAKTVTYDILKSMHRNFQPMIMCDPCATPPVINTSDMFERRSVSGISMMSMVTIDCGELDNEMQMMMPGTDCNQITEPGTALQNIITRKVTAQLEGFEEAESALIDELVITQGIQLPKSDYLPDGASLFFPRDEQLNCTTSETFGKDQCYTWAILRDFLDKIDCVDDGPVITDMYMHCELAEKMMLGQDMQECLKGFNPTLFLDQQLINEATDRTLNPIKGARVFYTSPDGIRFWKVNAKKRYCSETGEIIKYDLFPKDKIIALDRSGGDCQYQPIMGYFPITDLKHLTGGGTTQVTAFSPRYAKTDCTFHPAGWKQIVQSNMLPLLPTPNSSACLTLGVAKTEVAFEPKAEPVKKATANKAA
jgi:hypothetical protein